MFFNGTNESSFTHFADNCFSISSVFISNSFAILAIDFSLFTNFPGIIPTEEASPFPASILPFLSNISPLFACIVETLTLSEVSRPGYITESLHNALYWPSSSKKVNSFSKSTLPATVSKEVLYVTVNFSLS